MTFLVLINVYVKLSEISPQTLPTAILGQEYCYSPSHPSLGCPLKTGETQALWRQYLRVLEHLLRRSSSPRKARGPGGTQVERGGGCSELAADQ